MSRLSLTLCYVLLLGVVFCAPPDPPSAAESLMRYDPAKRIPLLTEDNWADWSWRISTAVAMITGITSSLLFHRQQSSECPVVVSDVENAPTVKVARDRLALARLKKQLASAEDDVEEIDEEIKTANAGLSDARDAARAAAVPLEVSPEEHPLSASRMSHKTRISVYQLFVRTISPGLNFLVIPYCHDTLSACWDNIREYFCVNTIETRSELKVLFFSMVLEPLQRLAEFRHRIDFSARQLNAMSPDGRELITEDDRVAVLMKGLRKNYNAVYGNTLDYIGQTTGTITFEEAYRKLLPVARRAESSAPVLKTEEGLYTRPAAPPPRARPPRRSERKADQSSDRRPCFDFAMQGKVLTWFCL